MGKHTIEITTDELVKLLSACNIAIISNNRTLAHINNEQTKKSLIEDNADYDAIKERLKKDMITIPDNASDVEDNSIETYASAIQYGDVLYDIAYGGIMEVTVRKIMIDRSRLGTYFIIEAFNKYLDTKTYANKDIRKTLFRTREEALPHAFSIDENGKTIPYNEN